MTDDPSTLGWFDAVLFAVKLWDTETAAAAIKPLLAAGGVVIPFQNGVESIERIGAVVGREQVMGGVAYIAARIAEPGVIAHTGTMARLLFGAVLPSQQDAARELLELAVRRQIELRISRRIPRGIKRPAMSSSCRTVIRAAAAVSTCAPPSKPRSAGVSWPARAASCCPTISSRGRCASADRCREMRAM